MDKALALADAVKQVVERLPVLWAVEQEPRVRRDVERGLRQAIVFQVHAPLAAQRVPAGGNLRSLAESNEQVSQSKAAKDGLPA